ncbi:MAG: DVU0298 family protein [bacterium]
MNNKPATSRLRLRKSAARDLLRKRNLDEYRKWTTQDPQVLRTLASLLFESDDLLRWRAIEALGLAAGQLAPKKLDSVQRAIRRLFWLMNDESGGICWCAPEAIAEILFNCPQLIEDHGGVLASYSEEQPFEAGVRWGVYRLGALKPEEFAHTHKLLLFSLKNEIPEMRAYSYLALTALKVEIPADKLDKLRQDRTMVPFYDFTTGELQQRPISELL